MNTGSGVFLTLHLLRCSNFSISSVRNKLKAPDPYAASWKILVISTQEFKLISIAQINLTWIFLCVLIPIRLQVKYETRSEAVIFHCNSEFLYLDLDTAPKYCLILRSNQSPEALSLPLDLWEEWCSILAVDTLNLCIPMHCFTLCGLSEFHKNCFW